MLYHNYDDHIHMAKSVNTDFYTDYEIDSSVFEIVRLFNEFLLIYYVFDFVVQNYVIDTSVANVFD